MSGRGPGGGCRGQGMFLTAGAVLMCFGASGCSKKRFKEAQTLGGRKISAAVLNRGYASYTLYCEACHGKRGDGKGPAAPGTVPPPRDFTKGYFKYVSVPARRLPVDADLLRTMNVGIAGSRMPPWDGIAERRRRDIVQYLKTLSGRWRSETPGTPIPQRSDPWKASERRTVAVAQGERVYHGVAQCWECHPSYQDRSTLSATLTQLRRARDTLGLKPVRLRGRLWRADVVPTQYGSLMPPDFLKAELHGGDALADLYRSVAAGIGGTPMPTWSAKLEVRDLWAVVHYVKSLLRLQGTPSAKALAKRLRTP